GDEQRAKPRDVRLAAAQLCGVEMFDLDPIQYGALGECGHALELERRRCDEGLAAGDERDAVLRAELLRRTLAALAEVGLEAARRVVDPAVDHAAVVAGLVHRQRLLLLEQHERRAGIAP